MTLFDYAVIIIVGASVVVSVLRGFVREILSLAGWVIAFMAASLLSPALAAVLPSGIPEGALRILLAFAAIFVTTLIVTSLIASVISRLLKSAGLGGVDGLLGSFFGFARGMLIVMVLVLLAGLTKLPRHASWRDALLSPPLEALAGIIKPWLPQVVSRYISYD